MVWRAKRKSSETTLVLDSTTNHNYELTGPEGAANLLEAQVTDAKMRLGGVVGGQREEETVSSCCQSSFEAMTAR